MNRRKIWASVGVAIIATSQVGAHELQVSDGSTPDRPLLLAAQGGQGEEGREGGAAYAAGLPKNLRFFRDIQLARGHLLVGNELVEQGRWAEALPHFLRPSEEIYPKIRDDSKNYGVISYPHTGLISCPPGGA